MTPLSGKRILIVEDEAVIAFAIEDMLSDLGCHVIGPAFDLAEALRLATEEALDAGVLDVNLNDQRSYDVAAELHRRNIPFLFATGYGEDSVGWDRSEVPVLAKPYRQPQVEAALTALLT